MTNEVSAAFEDKLIPSFTSVKTSFKCLNRLQRGSLSGANPLIFLINILLPTRYIFVYVVNFKIQIFHVLHKSKILSQYCCTKMILNDLYLTVGSRCIANNTSVLVFNLTKENSTSTLIFPSSADFILAEEEFEKRLLQVDMFVSL